MLHTCVSRPATACTLLTLDSLMRPGDVHVQDVFAIRTEQGTAYECSTDRRQLCLDSDTTFLTSCDCITFCMLLSLLCSEQQLIMLAIFVKVLC